MLIKRRLRQLLGTKSVKDDLGKVNDQLRQLSEHVAGWPHRFDARVEEAVAQITDSMDRQVANSHDDVPACQGARTSTLPVDVPAMPQLGEIHLRNARLLPSRDHILDLLPKGGTATELGVALGGFSRKIMDRLQPERFIAVDMFDGHTWPHLWGKPTTEFFGDKTHEAWFREQFASDLSSGRMAMHVGDSASILSRFPESYFDFIYVDADHSYRGVLRDLDAARRTIKPNGHIVMNDYTMIDPIWNMPYGVIQATNEFCLREGWEIIYFALEPRMFCDVVLRRLNI